MTKEKQLTIETKPVTGAELVIQALVDEGVEYLFNLPGNGVYPMLDPLAHQPIKYVLGLHEASLVSIADGYARASGKVPFVNLYMVPGTANALSAIYIANRDRVPMVVTSTQQSRPIIGRDAYASTDDLLGMVRGFTKWSLEVNAPERLPEAIHRAFKIAGTPPYGPVFLSMPVDLFTSPATGPLTEPSRPTAVPRFGAPDTDSLATIAEQLISANGVLFIAGKEVLTSHAEAELEGLASEIGAAVANEPWNAVTAFPTPHRLGFGEYHGGIFESLAPSFVLGVGARMFVDAINKPEPAFPRSVQVANLGLDAFGMGNMQASDLTAVCDVRAGLRALLEAVRDRIPPALVTSRLAAIDRFQAERRQEASALLNERYEDVPMSLARLSVELNKAID